MSFPQGQAVVLDNARGSFRAWRDRIRDPSLTVLLVLELCAMFLAAPLAAKGFAIARGIADALLLAVLIVVVMLSHRLGAIILILLGLSLIAASIVLLGSGWPPLSATVLR